MPEELTFDDIGPQRVHQYYDPDSGMRAVVVIDTTQFRNSGGGLRMLSDISLAEIALLARSMTYKFAWLDLNVSGAKAGIWFDPEEHDRIAVLTAFGRATAPMLKSHEFTCGVDMGTSSEDLDVVFGAAGRLPNTDDLAANTVDGLTLEELVTGYGVIKAAKRASEIDGRSLDDSTVAIEGLGKVGIGCARQAAAEGARLVAVSTLAGTRCDPDGLDVDKLVTLREQYGDDVVVHYPSGDLLPKEALYSIEADVLIPGARTHCIDSAIAMEVLAPLVVPAANAPLTARADVILHERGVTVVPDFISNAGGVLLAVVGGTGGGEDAAFQVTRTRITANVERALEGAKTRGVSPQTAAIAVARDWLRTKAAQGALP